MKTTWPCIHTPQCPAYDGHGYVAGIKTESLMDKIYDPAAKKVKQSLTWIQFYQVRIYRNSTQPDPVAAAQRQEKP